MDEKVTIHNQKDSEPVYIRAKVMYEGKYAIAISGNGWTAKQTDDYYYYGSSITNLKILPGGSDTSPLDVAITGIPSEKNPDGSVNPAFSSLRDGESFSVVVIYESTPVRYKYVDGSSDAIPYADWDAEIIEVGSTTGGNA